MPQRYHRSLGQVKSTADQNNRRPQTRVGVYQRPRGHLHPITPATGTAVARIYTLKVEHKEYQTRQLTVAPRYVEPPPQVSERIAREYATNRERPIFSDQKRRFVEKWRA